MNSFVFLFLFSINLIIDCSSLTLLNRLRKDKTILFQSKLSSPIEINIKENNELEITCSFYSNFHLVDIYWFHNGTLIESFLSLFNQSFIENDDENSYVSVRIVSKMTIKSIDFNENGFYECIAQHQQISAQQIFNVQINSNEIQSTIHRISTKNLFITVHTSEIFFESLNEILLICRMKNDDKDQCEIKWFDENDQLFNSINNQSDLILFNENLNGQMNFYTCQICCSNYCQKFISFVYPIQNEIF